MTRSSVMFAWRVHPDAGNSSLSTGASARGLERSKLATIPRSRVSGDAGLRYQAERWEKTYRMFPTIRESVTSPSISRVASTEGEEDWLTFSTTTLDPRQGEAGAPSRGRIRWLKEALPTRM